MINVEWRTVAQGFDYKKYLQRQIQDVLEDAGELTDKMGYYANAGEFNEQSLTYIRGGIADRLGLTGAATMEKLAEIAKAETGEHPLLGKRKQRDKVTRTIPHPETGKPIQLSKKDLERGFVIYKDREFGIDPAKVQESVIGNQRTSLELVYSLDKTFSYLFFSDLLTAEQKHRFQAILLQTIKDIQEQVVQKMIVDYLGQPGELMEYGFMHLDNRENDPHLHAHIQVSNVIRLADGTIRVIEPRQLFQRGCAERIDAQFKALFAQRFQGDFPGIPLESYDGDQQEINPKFPGEVKDIRVGFVKETLAAIRSKYGIAAKIKEEIDRDKKHLYELTQQRISDLRKQEQAGALTDEQVLERIIEMNKEYEERYSYLNSRRYNKEVQHRIKNKKRLKSLHEQQDQLVGKVSEMNLALNKDAVLYRQYDKVQILEILTNRNPKFTRNDLIGEFAKYMGLGLEAEAVVDKFLREHDDIFALPHGPNEQRTFTLKSLARLEKSNIDIFAGLTRHSHSRHDLAGYFKKLEAGGINLKAEQKAFVQNVFEGNGASLVVGLPGTGKSFAMKYAVGFARQQGYRTFGLAPTGKVAGALAEDTDPDYAGTIDKFLLELAAGKLELKAQDMIFVDEAGMVGTRHYNRLLRAVEASGAKLVLVGDNNQLDPVAAGNTFNELINRHADKPYTTILSEISRQKLEEAFGIALHVSGKAAMDAMGGTAAERLDAWQTMRLDGEHIKRAFKDMEDCGFVSKHQTTRDMVASVVAEFLVNHEDYKEKILLASTNNAVDHINEQIQQQRKSTGELGQEVETSHGIFHAGDRIVIRKNKKEVKNGDLGSIGRITHDGLLVVDFDNGSTKTIDPEKIDVGLGYAMTVHKSQGITKNTTIHVGEVSELNNSQLFNVAATRNRFQYSFHAVAADYEAIRLSYCRSSSKMGLMDIAALLDDEEDPVGEKQVRLERLKALREESPRPTISNEEIKDLMGVDLQAIRERAKALQEGTHAELDKVKVSAPDLEELHQEVLESIQRRAAPLKSKLVPQFARKLR